MATATTQSSSWVLLLAFLLSSLGLVNPTVAADDDGANNKTCSIANYFAAKISDSTPCVDPIARGATKFELRPVFPVDPAFVYAFDVQSEAEAKAAIPPSSGLAVEPAGKAAFWLEYTESKLDPKAKQGTFMAVLYHPNITGTPVGGHNGCDGVWGSQCSDNLLKLLKQTIVTADIGGGYPDLPHVLEHFSSDQSTNRTLREMVTNTGCPVGIFDSYYVVKPSAYLDDIAHEEDEYTQIIPSGSPEAPYISEYFDNTTYAELHNRAAVAILVRMPILSSLLVDMGRDDRRYRNSDLVQVDIVCAKAEPIPGVNHGPNANQGNGGANANQGNNSNPTKPNNGISARKPLFWEAAVMAALSLVMVMGH